MAPNSLLYTNNYKFNKNLDEGRDRYICAFNSLFLLYLSHNNVTFLPTSLYTLGLPLFLCLLPFQFYVFNSLSCFHHVALKILVMAPNFVTLPSSYLLKF